MVLSKVSVSQHQDMCQQDSGFTPKPDTEQEEEKWEEFFGTSVDITSTLLDMFDTIVAKNRGSGTTPCVSAPLPCDTGGGGPQNVLIKQTPGSGRLHASSYQKQKRTAYSGSAFEEKKRPLSSSSVSSSSSSSSSSLPRNGHDVKKSYLASIESLDDEDLDCPSSTTDQQRHSTLQGMSAPGPLPPAVFGGGNKPRWCDPNLSLIDRVVHEIVDTERTYVRDVNEIIQGYLKHIQSMNSPKISQQCLDELFNNIEDIHKFNSHFVEELEQCGMDPIAMAQCFVRNSEGFDVYTQYCTNYPRTVSVLTGLMGNSKTAEIFKERQTALQHSLPLGSYLLKPVQRILKYHLLLQNMVKHSERNSNWYADVKNALLVMTGIAIHINDMKRKHEHAVRVQEIQSLLYGWEGKDLTTYGELVAEGAFRMYRGKTLRHLFLFDKMILIAKKKEEGILSYKTHIMCSNLMLIESIQGEPLCFHVIPFDNPRFQYTFQARNMEQKREWCLQLKRVILENYNAVIPSHARQLVMELGQSKHDDSSLEKTSSKRHLLAPEYLEKRKQERRKSDISIKRGLKLKNGMKKSPCIRRKSLSTAKNSSDMTDSGECWSSQMDVNNDWGRSQTDICQSRKPNNTQSSSGHRSIFSSKGTYNLMFNRDTRLRHSLPEPTLSHRSSKNQRSFSTSCGQPWNSVPEETTDTENEDPSDHLKKKHFGSVNFQNESFDEPYDSSGEYVTFFYAHSYATRDWPIQVDNTFCKSPDSQSPCNMSVCSTKPEAEFHGDSKSDGENGRMKVCQENNPSKQWDKISHKEQDTESCSSGYSWKRSAAIRRVQSFTGMAKAKMSSLHHSMSFRIANKPANKPNAKLDQSTLAMHDPSLPTSNEDSSPTTPATWLKLQEEHLANGSKKSGSLPRSFQMTPELPAGDHPLPQPSDDCSPHWMRQRVDGQKTSYIELRPHTIASDKPSTIDFLDNVGNFVLECSPDPDADYCVLVHKDHYAQEIARPFSEGSPDIEDTSSIHPELKIYHQAASKYSPLKQLFSIMSSRIASLRTALSHPSSQEHVDMSSNENSAYFQNAMGRSSSRASIRSETDLGAKVLASRLVDSITKAYSAVVKNKSRKCDLKSLEKEISEGRKSFGHYKSEGSMIGARMAHPLESEYSVPKNLISPQQLKKWKEDMRPDSLFSEYSNATSSSDGDKTSSEVPKDVTDSHKDDDDSASDVSESSADSYYERKFDAIENALADDMFRDSAIYSDPEEADFSAAEVPISSIKSEGKSESSYQNSYRLQNDLICKRPVNQAIMERLKILEENIKYHREEAFLSSEARRNMMSRKTDCFPTEKSNIENSVTESGAADSQCSDCTRTELNSGSTMSNNSQSPPRIKGWVKHVVEKLQNEGKV